MSKRTIRLHQSLLTQLSTRRRCQKTSKPTWSAYGTLVQFLLFKRANRLNPTITLKCHGRKPIGVSPTSSKEVLQPGSRAHTATGCPAIRYLGACLTEQRTLDAARPVWCLRTRRNPQRSAATPCAAQSGAGAPQSLAHMPGCNVQRADGIGFAGYAKNHLTAIFFTLPLRPTVPRTVGFPTCRRDTPVVCVDRNCGFVRGWSASSGAARTGGGGSGGHGIGTERNGDRLGLPRIYASRSLNLLITQSRFCVFR